MISTGNKFSPDRGIRRKGYDMLAKIAEFFKEYYDEFSHREG